MSKKLTSADRSLLLTLLDKHPASNPVPASELNADDLKSVKNLRKSGLVEFDPTSGYYTFPYALKQKGYVTFDIYTESDFRFTELGLGL